MSTIGVAAVTNENRLIVMPINSVLTVQYDGSPALRGSVNVVFMNIAAAVAGIIVSQLPGRQAKAGRLVENQPNRAASRQARNA